MDMDGYGWLWMDIRSEQTWDGRPRKPRFSPSFSFGILLASLLLMCVWIDLAWFGSSDPLSG